MIDDKNVVKMSDIRRRDKAVYEYLLTLTDLRIKDSESVRNYSISNIADQWGTDRTLVKRVLDYLDTETYRNTKYSNLPGLTLDKLVNILASLRKHWLRKSLAGTKARKVTRLEIVKALRLFSQLSSDEEVSLGLGSHESKLLIQQLDDHINDLSENLIPGIVTKLYQCFISTKQEYSEQDCQINTNEDFINQIVSQNLQKTLNRDADEIDVKLILDFSRKVQAEISKIQIENGFDRYAHFNKSKDLGLGDNPDKYLKESSCISKNTIQILIKSIVENEVLTDEFPLYIKYIEVSKNRVLPLFLGTENDDKNGMLNKEIHDSSISGNTKDRHEDPIRIESLKSLFSYKVKVHFYIVVDKENVADPDGKDRDLNIDNHLNASKHVINFFEEITGVGSPLSHVIAAINRVLLWDIPILKDYSPIAKNLIIDNKILGSSPNSAIWSHNVVCLCKRQEVIEAIKDKGSCHGIFNTQEYAAGDYCGFDLLEVVAKAAFYARLRAIKQTGIDPKKYITQVLEKIREVNALRKSERLLNSYPFSVLAMEGQIEDTIFKEGKYRKIRLIDNKDLHFIEETPMNMWSMVAYQAHLAIGEAYLKEGLYKIGKKYLDVIQQHINRHGSCIDSIFVAKYYLSLFRYYYLIDSSGNKDVVKTMLSKSKEYLNEYVKKCHAMDELPQVNFNDFFYISSRICAHEAKIHIFMNRDPGYKNRQEELRKATYLFEESRIYAARQGNASLYSMWSTYQSWCYIMTAYLDNDNRGKHLSWAEKLLDHALVCYSEDGRLCYGDTKANAGKITKDKAGKINEYESYGSINIRPMPLIQEIYSSQKNLEYTPKLYHYRSDPFEVLPIDMSIFSWDYPMRFGRGVTKNTYLFGMPSTIFLFTIGMIKLCKDYKSDEDLLNHIKEAQKYFNHSWSISEEGLVHENRTDKVENYKRQFIHNPTYSEQKAAWDELSQDQKDTWNEFSIGGLYPHRITQFADFGKMFAIVCEIIIKNYDNNTDEPSQANQKYFKNIKYIFSKINNNIDIPFRRSLGQKKYNEHLSEIYGHFQKYIEQTHDQQGEIRPSITSMRDKIVSDVFTIITTRTQIN